MLADPPGREMPSDALDLAVNLARDLAEQVFTHCCARAGIGQAEQDRVFDRAEAILVEAVHDLLEAVGIADVGAIRHAHMCAANAFTARTVELCASGHGGDLVQ